MTDYNDGKWHGWNGGECPVDLGCLVEFQTIGGVDGRADHDPWAASHLSWFHDGDDGDVIAFRVTKPAPPKPREYWIVEWGPDYEGRQSFTKLTDVVSMNWAQKENLRITHVREVLP